MPKMLMKFGMLVILEIRSDRRTEKAGTLRGVFRNIDEAKIRAEFPETNIFECEK